jgi:hypothetical protein
MDFGEGDENRGDGAYRQHGHDGSGEADIFGDVQHPNGVVSFLRAADEMEQTTLVTVRFSGQ